MLKLLTVVLLVSSLKIDEDAELIDSSFLVKIYTKFFKTQIFFIKNCTKYALSVNFL